jgi:hypothetical protein
MSGEAGDLEEDWVGRHEKGQSSWAERKQITLKYVGER